MKKIIVMLFLCSTAVFAQDWAGTRNDIWVCPSAETVIYTLSGTAFGGGLSLGYGSGAAIGVKVSYFIDRDGLGTLELNFLLRVYIRGRDSFSGPFVQFSGGPAIFAQDNAVSVPSGFGSISAGVSGGWRFLLGDRYFVEPSIRAGYPYIAGGGVSAGVRF